MSLSSCFACSTWSLCTIPYRVLPLHFPIAMHFALFFFFFFFEENETPISWPFSYCIHCYHCVSVCVCALHCSLCARTLCIFHLCCFPLSISPFLSLCSRIELSSTYAELTKLLLSAASFIADQLTVFYISQYRLYDTNFLYEHCEMKAK